MPEPGCFLNQIQRQVVQPRPVTRAFYERKRLHKGDGLGPIRTTLAALLAGSDATTT
jgi:hypothetical protein